MTRADYALLVIVMMRTTVPVYPLVDWQRTR